METWWEKRRIDAMCGTRVGEVRTRGSVTHLGWETNRLCDSFLVWRAHVADGSAARDATLEHVRLVIVARVDERGRWRECVRRHAALAPHILIHQPADHIRVAEDGGEGRALPQLGRLLARCAHTRRAHAVRDPERVSEERWPREDLEVWDWRWND